jgi:hypothetical protein
VSERHASDEELNDEFKKERFARTPRPEQSPGIEEADPHSGILPL